MGKRETAARVASGLGLRPFPYRVHVVSERRGWDFVRRVYIDRNADLYVRIDNEWYGVEALEHRAEVVYMSDYE